MKKVTRNVIRVTQGNVKPWVDFMLSKFKKTLTKLNLYWFECIWHNMKIILITLKNVFLLKKVPMSIVLIIIT